MGNELVLHGVNDLKVMADAIAKSGLFSIKTAEQGIALMLIAQAEGLHPAVAARDYDIIQGRPALKARAMMARFQQSGGKVEWIERTDEAAEALFSHPNSPKPVSIRWDMARAQKAGLGSKDNWRKFSRQMLSARVISEGVTACYPAATSGLYVPEEVADFEDHQTIKASKVDKPAKSAKIEEPKTVEAEIVEPVHVEQIKESPQPELLKQEVKPIEEKPKTQPKQKNNVAEELASIRANVIKLGIKTREDYFAMVSGLAKRDLINDVTDLTADQRVMVLDSLKNMVAEKEMTSNG